MRKSNFANGQVKHQSANPTISDYYVKQLSNMNTRGIEANWIKGHVQSGRRMDSK